MHMFTNWLLVAPSGTPSKIDGFHKAVIGTVHSDQLFNSPDSSLVTSSVLS